MSLSASKLKIVKRSLHLPKLDEVADVLSYGLSKNFSSVMVEVVNCPDLSDEPYNLASPGLGGSPKLLEVGGPPFLIPLVDKSKIYDIQDLLNTIGCEEGLVIGAGAGPWPYAGKNCEMMANCRIGKNGVLNRTHIAKLCDKEENYSTEILPDNETRFALLANLYLCEGCPSKVIKVTCKGRTGALDFVTTLRMSLAEKYKEDIPVGLGGTFLIKTGSAKLHIMPSFSKTPLENDKNVSEWLKFFEMSSPLVCVGTLISSDIESLDLRVQHFHAFSDHNQGGHYHYDTTPDNVEYIGYFNLAESVIRVDQPTVTHSMGRD